MGILDNIFGGLKGSVKDGPQNTEQEKLGTQEKNLALAAKSNFEQFIQNANASAPIPDLVSAKANLQFMDNYAKQLKEKGGSKLDITNDPEAQSYTEKEINDNLKKIKSILDRTYKDNVEYQAKEKKNITVDEKGELKEISPYKKSAVSTIQEIIDKGPINALFRGKLNSIGDDRLN